MAKEFYKADWYRQEMKDKLIDWLLLLVVYFILAFNKLFPNREVSRPSNE